MCSVQLTNARRAQDNSTEFPPYCVSSDQFCTDAYIYIYIHKCRKKQNSRLNAFYAFYALGLDMICLGPCKRYAATLSRLPVRNRDCLRLLTWAFYAFYAWWIYFP
jgi:hypothetical protein